MLFVHHYYTVLSKGVLFNRDLDTLLLTIYMLNVRPLLYIMFLSSSKRHPTIRVWFILGGGYSKFSHSIFKVSLPVCFITTANYGGYW